MKSVVYEMFHKTVNKPFDYEFATSEDGLYMIEVSARARGEKQISSSSTDDDDLMVEIDTRKFPLLTNPQRYSDSPVSFSGGELHGTKKTVVFLLGFGSGKHKLTFIPDNEPTLEVLKITYVGYRLQDISLGLTDEAEDSDRRPWLTVAMVDLSVKEIRLTIKAERRFRDSDDVKIIIDDLVVRNSRNVFRNLWYWIGGLMNGDVEELKFETSLNEGLHYIELFADRKPSLKTFYIDFGMQVKRKSSVYDPVWTGDFTDDDNQLLLARAIYGEARNTSLSDKVRLAIGWSIRNRVDNPKWWGDSYLSVITKPWQYSAFNNSDSNRKYVENPFVSDNKIDKLAWFNCYEIAGNVIKGEVKDPTNGSNHYYDESITAPDWANDNNFKLKIGPIFFHKL